MIFYGILDFLAGPVFLFAFLWHLKDVDYNNFGFSSGKYTDTTYANGIVPHPVVGPTIVSPVPVVHPMAQVPVQTV